MRHHEQQKCDAFFMHVLTARLSASIYATMHAAILDACVRARLTIAVTMERTWKDIKTKVFLFVNIGAVLYFRIFPPSYNLKRKRTSYNAQFKLKVISYAEENSSRNFVPKKFCTYF